MLYIRTDGNGEIGTGHVMRCLSIAEEYRRQGGETIFLMADKMAGELVEKNGFSYICLNSAWNDLEQEIDAMVKIMEGEKNPLLLIDSYFVTEKYLSTLRKYTKIAYMDDLDQLIYPVDLLINYNIYAEQLDYQRRYREAGVTTKFAIGCHYVPLREEFKGRERSISQHVRKVLITTGGTDIYDVTGHLLEQLSRQCWFPELEFEIIVGKFNNHKDELEATWLQNNNVHFYYNVTDMARFMRVCDIAVTAGGSTVYELMACGTPSIVYTLADNQLKIARTVSEMEVIPWAGDVRGDIQQCCNAIVNEITKYICDDLKREKASKKMQELVDGFGGKRLVLLFRKLQLENWETGGELF